MDNYRLIGGFVGFLIPLFLFGTLTILTRFDIEFARFPFAAFIIFALAILEFPVAFIARSWGLPVEAGGSAFLFYDFNALGYILMGTFWILVGTLIGWLIDKKRCRKG